MKKQNVSSKLVAVAVGVAFVLPSILKAEDYDSYNSGFQKDFSKVESLIRSATVPRGSTADSFKESEDALNKIAEKLELNGKRKELFDLEKKSQNWDNKSKDLQKAPLAMQGAIKKIVDDRAFKAEDAAKAADRINAPSNQFAQQVDMSGAPGACKDGADFTPVTQLLSQMGQQPFNYMKRQAQELLAEKNEQAQAERKKKIADLISVLKDLNSKDEDETKGGKQADISKLDTDEKIEARIKELKAKNAAKKQQFKKEEAGLIGQFGKFVEQLFQTEKNDGKVAALGDEFAKQIENSQRMAMMMGKTASEKLYDNCKTERKKIDETLEQVRARMSRIAGWGPEIANTFVQGEAAEANKLACDDVSQNVQNTLTGATSGVNIQDDLNTLRSEKNPVKLLSDAVNSMGNMMNIQTALVGTVQPLVDQCTAVVNGHEKLKKKVKPIGNMGDGSEVARSSGNSTFRGSRQGGSSVGSPETHRQ